MLEDYIGERVYLNLCGMHTHCSATGLVLISVH